MSELKNPLNYIISRELQEIVNVSISLEKPLLVRGEPGTGKTRLAEAIAESLSYPLFKWGVKSTSKAQEGLYSYDAVQRLNDSRFKDKDTSDISKYIKLGPLGKAFMQNQKVVVLIDEIDKADIEFPNDLLYELDVMSFNIYETNEIITAKHRPIVIITSNAEKELPDAFLRRCLFHYISFPDIQQMQEIIKLHHPHVKDKIIEAAMAKFYWLREQEDIRKKPSTSELIDWVNALNHNGIDLKKHSDDFPFLGVLLKKEHDISQFKE